MIHDPDLSIEPNNVGPREHELKTWPEFFIEVIAGRKPFEIRFNDRDYHEGDTLWLREWSPTLGQYTGRETRQRVTYVMGGRFGVDPEYVVMGLKPREAPDDSAPGADDLTFGSVLDWMISEAFLRVDTLDPDARHKRYLECKLCGGTDAERNHPRPAQASVKHAEGCEFAKHLPHLRAMANKDVT